MKNLIEKISIKTGLTKLEVTALLFIFASIITGVGLHLAGVGSDDVQIASKEKSSWEMLQKEQEKLKKGGGQQLGNSSNHSANTKIKKEPYAVNINTADSADFEQLPEISPELAGKIIKERRNGFFQYVEDIKRVNGIGEVKFNKIKNYLRIKDE